MAESVGFNKSANYTNTAHTHTKTENKVPVRGK